jgi:hypothetical protein
MRFLASAFALRLRNVIHLLALTCLLTNSPPSVGSAHALQDVDELKIKKTEYTLVLNTPQREAQLEIEPTKLLTDIEARGPYRIRPTAPTDPKIATFDEATFTIKGVSAGSTEMKISYKPKPDAEAKEATIKIVVERRIKEVELSGLSIPDDGKIPMIQRRTQSVKVALRDKDKQEIKDAAVCWKIEPANNASVSIKKIDIGIEITADKKGTAVITIGSKDGNEPSCVFTPQREIKVEVKEAIQEITLDPNSIQVREGKDYSIAIKLKGVEGGEYRAPEREIDAKSSDPTLVNLNREGKLTVGFSRQELVESKNVRVTVSSSEGVDPAQQPRAVLTVNVLPRGGFITLSQSSAVMHPGGDSIRVTAYVHEKNGQINYNKIVTWSFADDSNNTAGKYIAISPQGNTVEITTLDKQDEPAGTKPPTSFKVRATYRPVGQEEEPFYSDFLVRLVEVATFSPLSVKLHILDDRSASDLYGKVTADEYYVAQVRIYNNLKDQTNGKYIGASILAFSASIQVAVALEKKYDKDSNSASTTTPRDGRWYRLEKEDLDNMINQGGIDDRRDASGSDTKELSEKEKQERESFPCRSTITYCPLTFEMIVNTVDRRDERSTRSRVFQGLNAFGTAFSFVTAIAQPSPNSDLPVGLEKYSNLFIPGIEKLWPSLRESHRQNIVSQTMKPIEEVPFGSDISRVLFFPKKPIRGMLAGNLLRISQICPYFFKVEVAVIEKGNKSTVTQTTRP